MAKICSNCKGTGGILKDTLFVTIKEKDYCPTCAKKYIDDVTEKIIITTTNNIDGFRVKRYIRIESVEVVMGTGFFSEFGGEISDFFGARSTAFEIKLQKAKETAFKKLKYRSYQLGGNAVIGIDIDYTEFSGNRIGVIANGTVVEVESV